MPHTRSAKLRTRKDQSDDRCMPETHDTSMNAGWNEYLNWNLPAYPYQHDSTETPTHELAWYTGEGATPGHAAIYDTVCLSTIDNANNKHQFDDSRDSGADFSGLQRWYSAAPHGLSSVSSAVSAQPTLSDDIDTSPGSSSIEDESPSVEQTGDTQPWSPQLRHGLSAVSDELHNSKKSNFHAVDHADQSARLPSAASTKENERIYKAKVNANKKRKIAHSVIEKNYRSRINDGMAELRHCVPATRKGRTATESDRTDSQQLAGDELLKNSSGKVATISDAVQYVKNLELRNEALHDRLELVQRRNDTLQKIALSKADVNGSDVTAKPESTQTEQYPLEETTNSNTRRKRISTPDSFCPNSDTKSTPRESSSLHHNRPGGGRAIARSPSLLKRHGSSMKDVNGL